MTLNLVADRTIKGRVYPAFAEWQGRPFHPSWREFDQHWPWTIPFRLEEYARSYGIDINVYASDMPVPDNTWYPIALGFFSFDIDYFSLVPATTLDRARRGDFKILFYYHEGDNPHRIKQRLDLLCAQHCMPTGCYVFVSGNTVASQLPGFAWFADFELWYWHRNRPFAALDYRSDARPCDFTVLVRGHRSWRMAAMADLDRQGLLDGSLWSYGEPGDFDDAECPIQVDSITGLRAHIDRFQHKIPHRCDDLTSGEHNDHSRGQAHLYTDSYVHVVLETHFDADQSGGAFVTEKTFKPIKHAQPFVVVSGPGHLQALRDLGYRVFDRVWDNTYDTIEDATQRWQAITELLTWMRAQGLDKISALCRDDAEHNQQLFQSLKQHRLNTLIEALNAK